MIYSITRSKMKFSSRKFYSLLFTSSIGMVIAAIVSLSDTIIAGQFGGETSAAAINLVFPLFAIIAFFASLVDIGTFQIYSFEMGRFNKARADKIFGQGLILTLFGGVILLLFIFLDENCFFQPFKLLRSCLFKQKPITSVIPLSPHCFRSVTFYQPPFSTTAMNCSVLHQI